MEGNLNTQELTQQAKEKEAYQPPQLFIYGDICEITQNVGKNGAADTGGTPPNVKTQP